VTSLPTPDWYDILEEFNKYENSILRDEYDGFWKSRSDDDLDELEEKYTTRFSNRRSASQYRKNALTTVMGAFLNRHSDNGHIYERTGWKFLELDPFETHTEASADILLAKPEEGDTMVVVLLPERQSPEEIVRETANGIDAVRSDRGQFGFRSALDSTYGAIVVNPPRGEETNRVIGSKNGYAQDIFVWRVYDQEEKSQDDTAVEERKMLDYYADLDGELNQTGPDLKLFDVLEGGTQINRGREILPDFFLQSHHSLFLEHIAGHVVQQRQDRGDGPITHFTREEVEDYIEDTLFEQEIKEEAVERAEFLLTRWEQMEIIRSIAPGRNDIDGDNFYRFTADGSKSQDKVVNDIIGNYQAETVDFYIEIDAMEEALAAYRGEYGEQATLSDIYNR